MDNNQENSIQTGNSQFVYDGDTDQQNYPNQFGSRQTTYVNPVNNDKQLSPSDKQKADRLCILSLICYFGTSVVAVLAELLEDIPLIGSLVGLVAIMMPPAAIVLMIIARVKYRQSKFAKVLMWLYIILAILSTVIGIIAGLLAIIACGSAVNSCTR